MYTFAVSNILLTYLYELQHYLFLYNVILIIEIALTSQLELHYFIILICDDGGGVTTSKAPWLPLCYSRHSKRLQRIGLFDERHCIRCVQCEQTAFRATQLKTKVKTQTGRRGSGVQRLLVYLIFYTV